MPTFVLTHQVLDIGAHIDVGLLNIPHRSAAFLHLFHFLRGWVITLGMDTYFLLSSGALWRSYKRGYGPDVFVTPSYCSWPRRWYKIRSVLAVKCRPKRQS